MLIRIDHSQHDGEPVRAGQLLLHPLDYDGRRITAEGLLTYGFEHSSFAGAWMRPPDGWREQHPECAREFHGYERFVRITGLWRANADERDGGFGHFGLRNRCLFAECIDEIPATPRATVSPGQLRLLLDALAGELVEASVPVVTGHEICRLDDLPDLSAYQRVSYPRKGLDPTEQMARLLLWIEHQVPHILRCEWLGEARALPVPRVSAAELPAYADHIVEVEGRLETGKYWPQLGPCELIPPEITTTDRAYMAFGYSTPPPEEIELWRRRIAAGGGALKVLVRGKVLDGGKKMSAYRLQQLPPA